jgi:hypothetical protein
VRREFFGHRTATTVRGARFLARSAPAAPPGLRIRTGGAGGMSGLGVVPGSGSPAARGRFSSSANRTTTLKETK